MFNSILTNLTNATDEKSLYYTKGEMDIAYTLNLLTKEEFSFLVNIFEEKCESKEIIRSKNLKNFAIRIKNNMEIHKMRACDYRDAIKKCEDKLDLEDIEDTVRFLTKLGIISYEGEKSLCNEIETKRKELIK